MKCQLSWFPKYFVLPELQLRMEKHKFNNRDIPQRDSVQFLENRGSQIYPKTLLKTNFKCISHETLCEFRSVLTYLLDFQCDFSHLFAMAFLCSTEPRGEDDAKFSIDNVSYKFS